MNQMIVRCTLRVGKPTLVAIASVYAAFPAQAGWIQDGMDMLRGNQHLPEYYEQGSGSTPLNPIDRNGFGYVNELGGGTDEDGYYRRPIPSSSAFGTELPNGSYEAPTTWDEDLNIQYNVEDGVIYQQNYRFNRGGHR